MKVTIAFIKKELLEQVRTGKLLFVGMLFLLLGIMNPAVAKLTPWLLEVLADSLAESGMTVTGVNVSAMDSWVQFFKNVPMGLIAFIVVEGGIFTKEYASGTLVLSLTKGLARYKVVLSKTVVLLSLWSAGYFLCFGITYLYGDYFWDNSIAQNLGAAILFWWLFGVLVVALLVLFSTLASSSSGVLIGCGGVVLVSALLGALPKIGKYLPTKLMDGNSLIYGTADADAYLGAFIVALSLSLLCIALSIPIFNRKRL